MSSEGTAGIVPPALSCDDLKKLLVDALDNASDQFNPDTYHARYDHPERDLDINDTAFGIRTEWKRCRPLRFSRFHWQWKYLIETENVDELPMVLIVAVDTANRMFEVITRWPDEDTIV